MKDRIRNFLHYCETVDFGKVELSKMESTFYLRFSNEILSLCRTLPRSVQTDSILFLMQYSGVNLGDELDVFANYYSPAWSIIYWLTQNRTLPSRRLKKEDVASAIRAQSMAMFLHSMDDHLTDHQLSISPLNLLLRSQAWMMMNRAFRNLAEGVPLGQKTTARFIDDYYSSMNDSKGLKSLHSYCDLFRRQMGIGMVAPILLSMKMTGSSDFTKGIEMAYGSFGIAWRLLDDIRDIGRDIEKGSGSAIYLCLPKRVMTRWKNNMSRNRAIARTVTQSILIHILEHGVIDQIRGKICDELEAAASIVEAHNLEGLAREFRCLAHPLRNTSRT